MSVSNAVARRQSKKRVARAKKAANKITKNRASLAQRRAEDMHASTCSVCIATNPEGYFKVVFIADCCGELKATCPHNHLTEEGARDCAEEMADCCCVEGLIESGLLVEDLTGDRDTSDDPVVK